MTVMKYETDIITSITAHPLSSWTHCDTGDNVCDTGDNVSDTGDNVCDTGDNVCDTGDNVFNVTMTHNFQYGGQSVDTENIS